MNTITICGLNKTINDTKVLKNVNITLQGGRIYGLKGPNKAGIVALMRILSGQAILTDGIVNFNDRPIEEQRTNSRKIVGALIEIPIFILGYTGMQNLQVLASVNQKINDEQIADLMKEAGLDPNDSRCYRDYPKELQHRLGIVAAIMEQPEVVVIDDPLKGQDKEYSKKIITMIRAQKARGAIVLVSCDCEEIENIIDYSIRIEY